MFTEYGDVQYSNKFTGELSLLYNVDGIRDLEYKLCEKHSHVLDADIAVKRFLHLTDKYYDRDKAFRGKIAPLARKYLSSLEGISYRSRSGYDKTYFYTNKLIVSAAYNKVLKLILGAKPLAPVFGPGGGKSYEKLRIDNMNVKHLIIEPENFIAATQSFVHDVLSIIRDEDEPPFITDHLFPPEKTSEYFKYVGEDVKAIILRRDPRDTYILAKEIYKGKIPVPCDTVDKFIWYYKQKIEQTKQEDTDKILNIQFEDLIYSYDVTRNKIESFLNIKSHISPKKYFDPNRSIVNTCLFRRYRQYERDVSVIESMLPKSLFKFDNYNTNDNHHASVF